MAYNAACVDYNIAAKAIANRLLQVLPSIIHSDQFCGVRGHNPVVNNRLMQDIVSNILIVTVWAEQYIP